MCVCRCRLRRLARNPPVLAGGILRKAPSKAKAFQHWSGLFLRGRSDPSSAGQAVLAPTLLQPGRQKCCSNHNPRNRKTTHATKTFELQPFLLGKLVFSESPPAMSEAAEADWPSPFSPISELGDELGGKKALRAMSLAQGRARALPGQARCPRTGGRNLSGPFWREMSLAKSRA